MNFANWLGKILQTSGPRKTHGRKASRWQRTRLDLEAFEARVMPATLTVSTLADNTTADSFLTLREAILLVDAGGNATTALGRNLTSGESGQITGTFGSNNTVRFASSIDGGTIALTSFINNSTVAGPSAFLIGTAITLDGQTGLTEGITITRSGSTAFRLFDVSSAGNLTVEGLTLSNGLARGGAGGSGGAAGRRRRRRGGAARFSTRERSHSLTAR